MNNKILICFVFIFLIGCTRTEDFLKEVLVKHSEVIDPNSAVFRNITHKKLISIQHWCGDIKVKNRLGGYVDWLAFSVYSNSDDREIHVNFYKKDDDSEVTKLSYKMACGRTEPDNGWVMFWNNPLGPLNQKAIILIVGGIALISGVLLIIFRSNSKSYSSKPTRTCPFCAEKINKEAIFCRFCKKDLPALSSEEIKKPTKTDKEKQEEEKIKRKTRISVWVGIIFITLMYLMIH